MAAAALALAACSGDGSPGVPTIPRATAAVSPQTAAEPAGDVHDVGAPVAALALDPATGTLAALTADGAAVLLVNTGGWEVRRADLPRPAAALAAGPDGSVLLGAGPEVLALDTATARLTPVPLADHDGSDVLAVALLPGGTVVAGTASGAVASSDGSVRAAGMVAVDAVAATTDGVAALDQQQTLLSQVNTDSGKFGLSLRAGNGATNLATDRHGRVLVANTSGGELLVYSLNPLMLRQRFPVPDAPFGVAYDDTRDVTWVTQTGRNEVVGYTLGTGIPIEVARFPTVRQPNSVVVDNEQGFVYIASAVGDGIQRIATGQGR